MASKVVRQRLNDQARDLIRAHILSLRYKPGERLVVDRLAEELKVSRTPVRDGLSALVEQGLVDYNGINYTVFKPTEQTIRDLFKIRATLESLSAKQATLRMTSEQLLRLQRIYEGKTELHDGSELVGLVDLDIVFHDTIMEGACNARLQKLLYAVREQCWLIRRWGFGSDEITVEQSAIDEHRAILVAMLQHDAEKAASLMCEHLKNSEERLMRLPNVKRLLAYA